MKDKENRVWIWRGIAICSVIMGVAAFVLSLIAICKG